MILKALYDYYERCGNLPAPGLEEKEIGFLLVLSKEGRFLRFEDCRMGKNQAKTFLVKKHVGRSSAVAANYLYDNSTYVLGYADMDKDIEKNKDNEKKLKETLTKRNSKEKECLKAFTDKVNDICQACPNSEDLKAICQFYKQDKTDILNAISQDPLWDDIKKNLSKKYSTFSFRIEGERKITAEKRELLQLDAAEEDNAEEGLCLITGQHKPIVDTTTATMIPGSQATAKLVAFQVNSGYYCY